MYSIKQASVRSGVSVALLRQWERRYGVVRPQRTESGYRSYDDEAIDRLLAMRHLVAAGWSPRNAADHIAGRDDVAVQALLQGAADAKRGDVVDSAAWPSEPVDAFVEAAARLDQSSMEAGLDAMFLRGSFEQVVETQLLPALRALGAAWAAGRIDVASEHVASSAILRRLAAAYEAAGRAPRSHTAVLVGLPPGARHELGALAFAIVARRAAISVLYVGADLPVGDWVEAAVQSNARAAVIGIVRPADVPAAIEVRDALRAARPDLAIMFGGQAAASVTPDGSHQLLPDGLTDAVDELLVAIRVRRA